MLTYNMDVETRSQWLRTTPGAAAQAQLFYCTESGIFYAREHFATARTDKESYILFYTLEGAGLIEQNGTQVMLEQGCALLMDCRTPQSYCTAPGQSHWYHYWAHIDGAGVKAMVPTLIPGQHLNAIPLPGVDARGIFDEILHGTRVETAAGAIDTALSIHKILAAMAHQRLTGETGSNRVTVERAAEYLRSHYSQPLCLDELICAAHMSKSYFLRLFRQYMGTTPYNYLLCYRITQAKDLLVLTDLPVGVIARRVGFADESNFSTRFSSMTGQSPLQYRRSALLKR